MFEQCDNITTLSRKQQLCGKIAIKLPVYYTIGARL